jgi:TnpA family transposase
MFDLPTVEAAMLHHYTLSDDDLEIIRARRRPHNRFGFALQLCALRYPGRLLGPGEVIPLAVSRFVAAQLGLKPDDLAGYAAREETRHEHLAALRELYGYKMFAGRGSRDLKAWLNDAADHVFAVTALLGFQFIPRIRDLPSKRLYLFDPAACPKELKGLIGGKIREPLIAANWPDILRSAATMATGVMPPSQLLRKFAAYPRQHELAVALREIGRVERTLFIVEWLLDADMQRRAQIGLNKGEAHHALKNALRIGRQGEIRDRTTEGQQFRMAGLNLLAAIIIYWNTKHLGHAITSRRRAALDCSPDLVAHISPLGWAHILLTGEYRWPKRA